MKITTFEAGYIGTNAFLLTDAARGEAVLIDAPHEVEPIHLPGDDFATARFSLVCWLCRPRADNPAAA